MNNQIDVNAKPNHGSRRDFIKSASLAMVGTAVLTDFPFVLTSHAQSDTPIRIGIIGCGGRGIGAGENALAASPNVKIIAVADAFEQPAKEAAAKFGVPSEQCFSGLDAYQKVCGIPEINYVILATPPGFRPRHFEAAVAAGKHIFCEKPVAVDSPGVRQILAAGEKASEKKICVVAGTQRRHQQIYIDTVKKIQDGAIGEVLCLRAYWNGGSIWHRGDVGQTDMEKQIRNWYHYRWLSGDHIVEQHFHNIDVCNWIMNDHPIRAYGMGGRQSLGSKSGHIYDHFAVEFEYKNGARLFSQCRQINGADNNVSEGVTGTKGTCTKVGSGTIEAAQLIKYSGTRVDPYVQEHADLMAAIRGTAPYINETRTVAESNLTAIMGRESAYTGQVITWEEAMDWKQSLVPQTLEWGPAPQHEIPMPGTYQIS